MKRARALALLFALTSACAVTPPPPEYTAARRLLHTRRLMPHLRSYAEASGKLNQLVEAAGAITTTLVLMRRIITGGVGDVVVTLALERLGAVARARIVEALDARYELPDVSQDLERVGAYHAGLQLALDRCTPERGVDRACLRKIARKAGDGARVIQRVTVYTTRLRAVIARLEAPLADLEGGLVACHASTLVAAGHEVGGMRAKLVGLRADLARLERQIEGDVETLRRLEALLDASPRE